MGLLDELDKYRSVFELIKNDESYNKKANVLTAEEVFNLCQDRYELMKETLMPLKNKLGEDIEIIEIGLANTMQDETNIIVRYRKDDIQKYFNISRSGFNDIEIMDESLEKLGFVTANKGIILDIFDRVDKEELDKQISINSTSKKFVISDIMKKFVISDINNNLFTIEGSHGLYLKEGLMYDKEKIITPNPKLKEALSVDENIMNIYKHLRVYEEDVPKTLIKKLINN
jgi:hypothetical protein